MALDMDGNLEETLPINYIIQMALDELDERIKKLEEDKTGIRVETIEDLYRRGVISTECYYDSLRSVKKDNDE
jgi:hypothetical protein